MILGDLMWGVGLDALVETKKTTEVVGKDDALEAAGLDKQSNRPAKVMR